MPIRLRRWCVAALASNLKVRIFVLGGGGVKYNGKDDVRWDRTGGADEMPNELFEILQIAAILIVRSYEM